MSSSSADSSAVLEYQIKTTKYWALSIPEGLKKEDWLVRVAGMNNHPHWLYGHIAVFSDFISIVSDTESLVPKEWQKLFGQGSKPEPEGKEYPAIPALSDLITRAMDRNLAMIKDLDRGELQAPPLGLPEEAMRFFKTRERWLFFAPLHLGYHLGQIQQIQRVLNPGSKGI